MATYVRNIFVNINTHIHIYTYDIYMLYIHLKNNYMCICIDTTCDIDLCNIYLDKNFLKYEYITMYIYYIIYINMYII